MCLLLSMLFATRIAWATEPYEVIANPSVSEKTLSKSSLRAIFGMRLHNLAGWNGDQGIRNAR